MSFEFPEKKVWGDKKSPMFREWLLKNGSLPEERWDADFKEYILKRFEDRKQALKERENITAEERIWKRYFRGLDLDEDKLKGKRIFDAGCMEGVFVKRCLESHISDEVYGMDKTLVGAAREEKYVGHFIEGDFHDSFPIRNLDYVFFVGSLHMSYGTDSQLAVAALRNALEALAPGGEVRVSSISLNVRGKYAYEASDITKFLDQLAMEVPVNVEIRVVDLNVHSSPKEVEEGKYENLGLQAVVILKNKETA